MSPTNALFRCSRRFVLLLLPFSFFPLTHLHATLMRSGDRHYFYSGLGIGMGGFDSSTSATINGHEHVFNNKNGWVAGGVTMGLQGHIGFEYRARNHFYVAAEVNGNAMFNGTVNHSTFSDGGYNFDLSIVTYSQTSSGKTIAGGTNGFGGIYGAVKLGWTDSRDALAVYAIIGAGYEFIEGTISATSTMLPGTEELSARANVELGGGRVQFGLGLSYYFNKNFGFYMQFIMTSPIHQYRVGTIVDTSPVAGGRFDTSKFPHITDSVSYTYFINVGLNIRV